MIPRPKLRHPLERCNEVSFDNIGYRPVGSGGLSRVWDSNPSLLDWKTSDRYLGGLGCGFLKELWEECL